MADGNLQRSENASLCAVIRLKSPSKMAMPGKCVSSKPRGSNGKRGMETDNDDNDSEIGKSHAVIASLLLTQAVWMCHVPAAFVGQVLSCGMLSLTVERPT